MLAFRKAGHEVVVLDELPTGYRTLVLRGGQLIEVSVAGSDLVEALVDRHVIRTAVHFAGSIIVPESVADPLK